MSFPTPAASYTTITGKVRVDATMSFVSSAVTPDPCNMRLSVDGTLVPLTSLAAALAQPGASEDGFLALSTVITGLAPGAHTFQLVLTSGLGGGTVMTIPPATVNLTLADSLN